MTELQALFLGIVQGVTEFLPVSSSGHLIVFEQFMALGKENAGFNVAVHLGTLASVLTIYFPSLKNLIVEGIKSLSRLRSEESVLPGGMLIFYVGISSIPTGLMGVFFKDMWHALFADLKFVGIFFIITGFILFLTRSKSLEDVLQREEIKGALHCKGLNWKKALILGVVQGCAIAPGISRSGSTIAAGLYLGLNRPLAAFYSFLLMIPAVLGAGFLELKDYNGIENDWSFLLVGLVASYISGVIGLKLIIKMVKKGRLEVFSPYLWLLGASVLVYSLLF